MLSLFKSNNPGVVVFYFLYLVLFRICFLFVSPDPTFVFHHHEPLSKFLFDLLKNLPVNYNILSLILSSVLCFVQALIVNGIVNENKILSKKNYIGGVFFILFSSFFKESLLLTPACIALTFLVICMGKIFSLIRKEKSIGDIFDVGFLVAIATLFYFPSILFILFVYIGLATVRPFSYREWIGTLTGFFCPFFLAFTIYFWQDNSSALLPHILNSGSGGWMTGLNLTHADALISGFLSMLIIGMLAFLPSALYSSLIQIRKFSILLVLFIFLAAVSFALQHSVSFSHWVLLGLPLAIIGSMVMMRIHNKLVSEVIHLILILLVLAGQYLPIFKII